MWFCRLDFRGCPYLRMEPPEEQGREKDTHTHRSDKKIRETRAAFS